MQTCRDLTENASPDRECRSLTLIPYAQDRAVFDRWARDTSMGGVDWDGLGPDAPQERGVVRQIGRGEFRPRRASDLRVDLGLWDVAPPV